MKNKLIVLFLSLFIFPITLSVYLIFDKFSSENDHQMYYEGYTREIENSVIFNTDYKHSGGSISYNSLPISGFKSTNTSAQFSAAYTNHQSSANTSQTITYRQNNYSQKSKINNSSTETSSYNNYGYYTQNNTRSTSRTNLSSTTGQNFPTLALNLPSKKSSQSKIGFSALVGDENFEPFANTDYGPMRDLVDPGDLPPEGAPIPIGNNIQVLIALAIGYGYWKFTSTRVA